MSETSYSWLSDIEIPHALFFLTTMKATTQLGCLLALCFLGCQPGTKSQMLPPERPNIVLIMADDMGYSDIACYGSEIPTPNLDQLAQGGVRLSQFYNQARCCPTRATLMTGLYPHQAGIGHMTHAPYNAGKYQDWTASYQGFLNRKSVTAAEVLGQAGYHCYMAGKWHLGYQDSSMWPLQRGFDRYYGILLGASSYFKPQGLRGLTLDNQQLAPPDTAYYTTDAFTSYAIDFIQEQKDEEPFFLYLAYNAPHWPLHAKDEDIERFQKKYQIGWDSVRKARHERQIEMGLLEPSWPLSERDKRVRPWHELTAGEKDSTAYRMAVYAAQVYSIDENVGRLIQALKAAGKYENTLILFLSDNGGCAETYDELGSKPMSRINDPDFGGAVSYGIGWANASNTPFYEYKVRTYEGGISTPFIMHWPAGMRAQAGSIRHEPAHLIDVMPTLLDMAQASYPKQFHDGQDVLPLAGKSLAPFIKGSPFESHAYMAWEHQSHQAVRKGPWKAVKKLEDADWQLFDMEKDRTETQNLADQHPQVVNDLADYWGKWAKEMGVLPKKKN